MKIGLFDSGLGGLIITHSLIAAVPEYDYVYLGDTARVPYGNRSQETIYAFTREAVDYLFEQDCGLIIVACNTASADALRRIQQEYLPRYYPDRRVLGVLIPAVEAAAAQTRNGRVGLIATRSAVDSQAFTREIHKINPEIEVFAQAAPLLVPLIENDALKYGRPILEDYLSPLKARDIDTLILGCTHYPFLRPMIEQLLDGVNIVGQDEIMPAKLQSYLRRHQELENRLSRGSTRRFLTTDLAPSTNEVAKRLFGVEIKLEKVALQP